MLYRNPTSLYRSYAVGSGPFSGERLPQPQPQISNSNNPLDAFTSRLDALDENMLLLLMAASGIGVLYGLAGGTGILGKATPSGPIVGTLIGLSGLAIFGYTYLKRKGSV